MDQYGNKKEHAIHDDVKKSYGIEFSQNGYMATESKSTVPDFSRYTQGKREITYQALSMNGLF
ncbi:hypothetical protein NSE_0727 [Neorickettsia sennetsu str. Miyayama]|uniref:Uncharacterized protein n=1 Tax=Ehrlichia sennetsu (strain ATCC VR-367 / Miyayama) TaxID=222891 RepID=Q2GD43_EHRS3|nr:hypothetical protein NSE_0727 [Neorickettsia sennetsu str. Miyayama]